MDENKLFDADKVTQLLLRQEALLKAIYNKLPTAEVPEEQLALL